MVRNTIKCVQALFQISTQDRNNYTEQNTTDFAISSVSMQGWKAVYLFTDIYVGRRTDGGG